MDREVANRALEFLTIDVAGLDGTDRKILRCLLETFGGRPVGLNTLALAVGEEAQTLEDVYEPYLLQIGFLERTSRGRVGTESALRHLGLSRDDVLFD